MSKNKPYTNQHLVPVAYLRRFAEKYNTAYRIGVKQRNKKFINSINNVGYIKNYYDIEDDCKKWEHFYSTEIEPLFGAPLDKIIEEITPASKNQVIINAERKRTLGALIISQWLRVPQYIDEKLKQLPSIIDQLKKEFFAQNKDKLPKELEHKIMNCDYPHLKDKNFILSVINDKDRLSKFIDILSSKLWVMLYNSCYTEIPFITCDNPVITINYDSHSIKREDNGIDNNKTIITFPLSPCIAIAIFPMPIKNYAFEMDGKTKVLTEQDYKLISNINNAIIEQSYREVFIPLCYFDKIK